MDSSLSIFQLSMAEVGNSSIQRHCRRSKHSTTWPREKKLLLNAKAPSYISSLLSHRKIERFFGHLRSKRCNWLNLKLMEIGRSALLHQNFGITYISAFSNLH